MENKKHISLQWTRGLNTANAQAITERFIENYDLIEILQSLIAERIEIDRKEQLSKKSFELPAWSENQAYLNGRQSALEEIKQLLLIRDKSDHDRSI